jgi:hypothetical protein
MSKLPEPRDTIVSRIDRHHEELAKLNKPRPYFGISSIGHECDRWLWLQFRWAVTQHFNGRMLRLFRRGQNEEAVVVSDLREIGMDVRETGYHQRTVYAGGFVEGNMDGVIYSGVIEAPKTIHVLEIKTHSSNSFNKLEKEGVRISKPMHYAQMQCYMRATGYQRALYVAVCKDDDRMYTERVRLDPDHADKLILRGKRLSLENRLPPPCSTDSSCLTCMGCQAFDFCYNTKKTMEVNCRTCAHATPRKDGTFYCEKWQDNIPVPYQYEGCQSHVLHPDLVPWPIDQDASDRWNAVYLIDGRPVKNGEKGYPSKTLLDGGPFDDVVGLVCKYFNGMVISWN